MSDIVRAHVHVRGVVQGVYFRQHTLQAAHRLGVVGWVRNLPDRRVEAVFEGPRPQVEAAVAWCWEGSPASRVEQVDVDWEPPAGDDEFLISDSW